MNWIKKMIRGNAKFSRRRLRIGAPVTVLGGRKSSLVCQSCGRGYILKRFENEEVRGRLYYCPRCGHQKIFKRVHAKTVV